MPPESFCACRTTIATTPNPAIAKMDVANSFDVRPLKVERFLDLDKAGLSGWPSAGDVDGDLGAKGVSDGREALEAAGSTGSNDSDLFATSPIDPSFTEESAGGAAGDPIARVASIALSRLIYSEFRLSPCQFTNSAASIRPNPSGGSMTSIMIGTRLPRRTPRCASSLTQSETTEAPDHRTTIQRAFCNCSLIK